MRKNARSRAFEDVEAIEAFEVNEVAENAKEKHNLIYAQNLIN